jgi:hypothetical protein
MMTIFLSVFSTGKTDKAKGLQFLPEMSVGCLFCLTCVSKEFNYIGFGQAGYTDPLVRF